MDGVGGDRGQRIACDLRGRVDVHARRRTAPRTQVSIRETTAFSSSGSASRMDSTAAENRGGFFGGMMDEARVWNRALTQAEIQSGMNQEITSGTGLLGRWGLNENTGTIGRRFGDQPHDGERDAQKRGDDRERTGMDQRQPVPQRPRLVHEHHHPELLTVRAGLPVQRFEPVHDGLRATRRTTRPFPFRGNGG